MNGTSSVSLPSSLIRRFSSIHHRSGMLNQKLTITTKTRSIRSYERRGQWYRFLFGISASFESSIDFRRESSMEIRCKSRFSQRRSCQTTEECSKTRGLLNLFSRIISFSVDSKDPRREILLASRSAHWSSQWRLFGIQSTWTFESPWEGRRPSKATLFMSKRPCFDHPHARM